MKVFLRWSGSRSKTESLLIITAIIFSIETCKAYLLSDRLKRQ